MDIEVFKRAEKIQKELDTLKRWINDCHHISSVSMYIEQKGERPATTDVHIENALSDRIMEAIQERIETLEKEFENL